jgi:hypothetical protein
MIHALVDTKPPAGDEAKEDIEQLVYDMKHGARAIMHAVERDLDGSAPWWLVERLCEQAQLLEDAFGRGEFKPDAAVQS